MRGLLRVVYHKNKYEIDIEIIKKQHIRFIADINRKNFGDRDDVSARRLTDILFSNNNYIIEWVDRNLDWSILSHLDNIIDKTKWIDAEKEIIYE